MQARLLQAAASASKRRLSTHSWLHRQPPTMVTALPNGMRVASQFTSDETVTVGVWIDAGSRYETRETNGSAHFLEHMAFKGTKRRTRIELEKEVENMGAHLNAYTSREQTVYYAKCFKDDLAQGVDILADILTDSTMSQMHLEHERGVILREMEEVEKITEEVIFDRLHLTAFNDSPLGLTILGPVENIQSLKQENLKNYIKANYTSDRIVVCAAGMVDHDAFAKLVSDKFSVFPQGKGGTPVQEKPAFHCAELLYRADDPENNKAHCAVAYEGVPWLSKDSITFMVMQSTLGSFKNSESLLPPQLSGNRLTQRVSALEGGVVESFGCFNTCYKDTGLFGFYAHCDEEVLDKCMYELMWGITSLAHSVTEEEVERGKRQLKATLFSALDSTTAIAEDIGRQLLVYGRRIQPLELLLRIEAVTVEEVQRCAKKYFIDRDIAVTGLGPLSRMPSLEDLRRQTSIAKL